MSYYNRAYKSARVQIVTCTIISEFGLNIATNIIVSIINNNGKLDFISLKNFIKAAIILNRNYTSFFNKFA